MLNKPKKNEKSNGTLKSLPSVCRYTAQIVSVFRTLDDHHARDCGLGALQNQDATTIVMKFYEPYDTIGAMVVVVIRIGAKR